MDLSESRGKFLAILGTYRSWAPHVAVGYDFERREWIAAALPLSGKADTPEEAFRELVRSTIRECRTRIRNREEEIAFDQSMIGELEGLL